MNCPVCNSEGAYVGLADVECKNAGCRWYKEPRPFVVTGEWRKEPRPFVVMEEPAVITVTPLNPETDVFRVFSIPAKPVRFRGTIHPTVVEHAKDSRPAASEEYVGGWPTRPLFAEPYMRPQSPSLPEVDWSKVGLEFGARITEMKYLISSLAYALNTHVPGRSAGTVSLQVVKPRKVSP